MVRSPARHPDRAARGHWYSSERVQAAALGLALLLLELLPLVAVLAVLAGSDAGNVARLALPVPFLVAALALFACVARLLRARPFAVVVAVVLLEVLLFPLAMRLSPSAYGDVPGGLFDGAWLSALATDLANGARRLSNLVGLGLLTVYVGWRGVAVGRGLPDLERVLARFRLSVIALIVATIGSVTVQGPARAGVAGVLVLCLPLTVFVGLLAAALARATLTRQERGEDDQPTGGGRRWVGLSLALAGGVVVAALLLSAVISFGSVTAALRALGPVGAALATVLGWVIMGIAQVLFLLLSGPLDALGHLISQGTGVRLPPLRPAQNPNHPAPANQVPPLWEHLAEGLLIAVVVVAVILAAIMLLRMALGRPPTQDDGAVAEERESLDGRALLRAQLRDLLSRWGRRPPQAPEEALPAGSVRAVYREVLRTAQAHGVARAPAETPDEFGARLGATLMPTVSPADVAALSEAYDAARYAAREPAEPHRRAVREYAEQVLSALRQRGRAR